jgi:hypothetical protein
MNVPRQADLFLIHLYRGIGAHFGAHATARTLAVALEFGGMIPLGIQFRADDDTVSRTGFHAEMAAFAPLLEDYNITFSFLLFSFL